jgi:hypothetical protein
LLRIPLSHCKHGGARGCTTGLVKLETYHSGRLILTTGGSAAEFCSSSPGSRVSPQRTPVALRKKLLRGIPQSIPRLQLPQEWAASVRRSYSLVAGLQLLLPTPSHTPHTPTHTTHAPHPTRARAAAASDTIVGSGSRCECVRRQACPAADVRRAGIANTSRATSSWGEHPLFRPLSLSHLVRRRPR